MSARHAANVTVRNLVIDCQRLPFTFGTIVAPATGRRDGSVVAMKMGEPDRLEFNVYKYTATSTLNSTVPRVFLSSS